MPRCKWVFMHETMYPVLIQRCTRELDHGGNHANHTPGHQIVWGPTNVHSGVML